MFRQTKFQTFGNVCFFSAVSLKVESPLKMTNTTFVQVMNHRTEFYVCKLIGVSNGFSL